MVIGKEEFNKAMVEINASYAKLWARLDKIDQQIAELKAEKPKSNARAA